MAVELVGDAAKDMQAEVLANEDLAEAMEHEEVPGQDEGEEEREAEGEVSAQGAKEAGAEGCESDKGEEECAAGGSLGHEGDGEAQPVEVPAREVVAVDFGQADDGEQAAEGKQGVCFADASYVQKTEGGEEDERAEPGGEARMGYVADGAECEPAVQQSDGGHAGERGAEARGEL